MTKSRWRYLYLDIGVLFPQIELKTYLNSLYKYQSFIPFKNLPKYDLFLL